MNRKKKQKLLLVQGLMFSLSHHHVSRMHREDAFDINR